MNRSRYVQALMLLIVIFGIQSFFSNWVSVQAKDGSMMSGVNFVGVNPSMKKALAKLTKDAGMGWVRFEIRVSNPEQPQSTYQAANQHSLKMIATLDYATLNWKASFTLNDWQNAVRTAQIKYPNVHVWEIWNEPTLKKFQLGYMDGTPEHYFELLKSAYTILKARDPSATVLGLGGAQLGHPDDVALSRGVFSLGGGNYMDAISIHAYAYQLNMNPAATWDYYRELWTKDLEQYKQFGKPIWVTETGLMSTQLNEQDQSAFLQLSYAFFKAQEIAVFIWFNVIDFQNTPEQWGLFNKDMTPKLTFSTYKVLLRES